MTLKKITFPFVLVTASILAGCAYDTDHHGASAQIEPSHNLLGIVKTSPSSYINDEDALLTLSTDELWGRRDYSGSNVNLLWGALSISDY